MHQTRGKALRNTAAKATAMRTAAACPGVGSRNMRVMPGNSGELPIGAHIAGSFGRVDRPCGASVSPVDPSLDALATMQVRCNSLLCMHARLKIPPGRNPTLGRNALASERMAASRIAARSSSPNPAIGRTRYVSPRVFPSLSRGFRKSIYKKSSAKRTPHVNF